jgi:hypothetical protein
VVETKPQDQTETQDATTDDQALAHARDALHDTAGIGQQKIYVFRLVGVEIMVYIVSRQYGVLQAILSDYVDVRDQHQCI